MSQIDLNFDALVDRYFDDTSLSGKEKPEIVVLMGTPAGGKTTIRKEKYSLGYVLVDAADIFLTMSNGEYFDFPGPFEKMMPIVGEYVADRAVKEKRHIVTEIIGSDYAPTKQLLDAMLAAGYRVNIQAIDCSLETAMERNENRGDDNVSAYYAEQYQRTWLQHAAAREVQRRNG